MRSLLKIPIKQVSKTVNQKYSAKLILEIATKLTFRWTIRALSLSQTHTRDTISFEVGEFYVGRQT